MRTAIFAFLMLASAGWISFRAPGSGWPRADEINPPASSAVEDAGFLALGLRRLSADLNFIRLMQYYGSAEAGTQQPVHHHHHHHEGEERLPHDAEAAKFPEYHVYGIAEYPELDFESGVYSEMKSRAMHILKLDPYFSFAALYAAGSLAFNLSRPDEALEILSFAHRYNPSEWRLGAYIAAIGYSKAENPGKVADLLDPVVSAPDAPTIIKQQTAFLNKKIGRYRRAWEIYRDILLNSKDRGYAENARRQMSALEPFL